MIAACFAWDDVIDMHLTLICATQLAASTITHEYTLTLLSIASAV
jgi:hypothetical protein